jgi:hypothetical protein
MLCLSRLHTPLSKPRKPDCVKFFEVFVKSSARPKNNSSRIPFYIFKLVAHHALPRYMQSAAMVGAVEVCGTTRVTQLAAGWTDEIIDFGLCVRAQSWF